MTQTLHFTRTKRSRIVQFAGLVRNSIVCLKIVSLIFNHHLKFASFLFYVRNGFKTRQLKIPFLWQIQLTLWNANAYTSLEQWFCNSFPNQKSNWYDAFFVLNARSINSWQRIQNFINFFIVSSLSHINVCICWR